MDTVVDFEDMLDLLERHGVRYLIIGGLAFIFHAKPRFTKDMDVWVAFDPENVAAANRALAEFGSPTLLSTERDDGILQIGIAPDRLDFFLRVEGADFDAAFGRRVRSRYGRVDANWIALADLLAIKAGIDSPRHQEDARVLREVLRRRGGG
jgi:hypothetical protein